MSIDYYMTSSTKSEIYPGLWKDLIDQIEEAITAVDTCLPGVRKVLEGSGLAIVYDERNRNKVFGPGHRGHRAAYDWPRHTIFLAKSGIRNSIGHEIAHILDMLSGPTLAQTRKKFGNLEFMARSVYAFYPPGGRLSPEIYSAWFDPQTNFTGWFLVQVILEMQLAREQPKAYQHMLEQIQSASIGGSDNLDSLVMEQVAGLMEEYLYITQLNRGVEPLGVGDASYFARASHIFWGRRWIEEHQEEIERFFSEMIRLSLLCQKGGFADRLARVAVK